MSRKKYGVVILNYRCANDSVIAAKTVMENAEDDNYVICIVEGGSGDEKEKEILKNAKLKNTHILFLNNNYGYARGNNEGVRFLNERYELDYIVIMNPDVCIVQKSTIEDVIKENMEIDNTYVDEIVHGVCDNMESIDKTITKYLDGWDLDRLGKTDRAILRLGTYEILFYDTPKIVAINEAVELSKKYSDDKVVKLVNAVLDKIRDNEAVDEQ